MADLPTDQVQWDAMTVPSTLARAARMWPDVSALEDAGKTFTFRELEAAAQEACRAFIASGVERGDRVAIWAPNSWRWEIAALACRARGRPGHPQHPLQGERGRLRAREERRSCSSRWATSSA